MYCTMAGLIAHAKCLPRNWMCAASFLHCLNDTGEGFRLPFKMSLRASFSYAGAS